MELDDSQLNQFNNKGYLVFKQLFSLEQMESLRNAANDIIVDFDPASTRSIFSTHDERMNRDQYFLSSGDKIRCFFEEEAFDRQGILNQQKHLSINKIGHALHRLNPTFSHFSQSPLIASIAEQLGVVEPEIRQSMYIFKQPKIGGEIRWHQDATYFMTTPSSVVTFWFAIEDATRDNGCLQIDRDGANFPIKEQFMRFRDDSTELVRLHEQPWPDNKQALPLEVKAGSLIVFNGQVPHYSDANRSPRSRHAFTLHITSSKATYDPRNWLQASPIRISGD